MRAFRIGVACACACLAVPSALAEIYVYRGPNGERLATDRPMPGYRLISRQDSVRHAGHMMANRPVAEPGQEVLQSYIRAASERHGVDPALVEAVIIVESAYDMRAESRAGAQGLMQLMPKTAQQYDVADRRDPRENINAGVKHLSELMKRFDGNLQFVLAAYNAGIAAVEKYGGVPPYQETQRYVSKVLEAQARRRSAWAD